MIREDYLHESDEKAKTVDVASNCNSLFLTYSWGLFPKKTTPFHIFWILRWNNWYFIYWWRSRLVNSAIIFSSFMLWNFYLYFPYYSFFLSSFSYFLFINFTLMSQKVNSWIQASEMRFFREMNGIITRLDGQMKA